MTRPGAVVARGRPSDGLLQPGGLLGQIAFELVEQLLLISAGKTFGEKAIDPFVVETPPTGLLGPRIDGEEERAVGLGGLIGI